MYDPNEVLIARVDEILSEAAEEDERRAAEKAQGKVVPLAPVAKETEEKAPARRRLA